MLSFLISKKFKVLFSISIIFVAWQNDMLAVDVTLDNRTTVTVYAALYYAKSNLMGISTGPATRPGDIVEIKPMDSIKLPRPSWKLFTENREIIFSENKGKLKKNLTKEEFELTSHQPAGQKYGSTFHISQSDGVLSIFNEMEWKVLEPLKSGVKEIIEKVFRGTINFYKSHPYANVQATVRQSFVLCQDEKNAVAQRSVKTKKALESLLNVSLPGTGVPRIGVCMSGGGVRAATCAYGFFAGLNEIGLLDAVTYAVGLSGSTWMLSGFFEAKKPINEYREIFFQAVTQEHLLAPSALVDSFLQKYAYDQQLNVVDLYGVYLSNKFFRNLPTDLERQRVWFSEFRTLVQDGSFMFPICTAVEMTISPNKPFWFTFSPYEVGSDQLGFYLPIWALGRKFDAGVSAIANNPPELRLGFLMGLWGSALSSAVSRTFDVGIKKEIKINFIRSLVEKILGQTIGPKAIAPIEININNPFYGMSQSIYKDVKELTFVDAGTAYNIPFLPLLNKNRSVDIIIALDSSGNVHQGEGAGELRKAENHIREFNLPFPHIDYTDIVKRPVSVFADPDPSAPIVIYVVPVRSLKYPELGNPAVEFSNTYKTSYFTYPKPDANRLIDLVRDNIIDNKELIIGAIKKKMEQKSKTAVQKLKKGTIKKV